jgi:hypothetical protein
MSDHLPVVMKVVNTFTNSVESVNEELPFSVVYNGSLILRNLAKYDTYEVIDLQGRVIQSERIEKGEDRVLINALKPNSMYLVRVANNQKVVTLKVRL